MTSRTRYFFMGAIAVLLVGLAVGLVAYLALDRGTALPSGLPPEVRFVPSNAEVVAFADVHAVMTSDLRRQLMPTIEGRSRKGRQMMNDFAGVDLEKQVNRVVAYVEPQEPQAPANPQTPASQSADRHDMPRALILVNGAFDQARIEQFVRDHGAEVQEHNGRKIFVHRKDEHEMAVGLFGPDLIAIGQGDLVRRALERAGAGAGEPNITTNREMMTLIRDSAGSTAWVVGQFDVVRRRLQLPTNVTAQVPPVRLMSAKVTVNGGMKATIRAEAGDKAAADQLRDTVRGFVSLARLHGGTPALASTLKSIELSGTNNTVLMSFAISPDTLRSLAPGPPPPSR